MKSLDELQDRLSQPSEQLIRVMENIEGDILLLGVGGKMGPSLAKLAKRATSASNKTRRIIGVSRFSDDALKEGLENHGIETITADLMVEE